MAYKGRVYKGGAIRDEKGRFASYKELAEREVKIIMGEIKASVRETFLDFAYSFFTVDNLTDKGVPLYSGNLIDSMSIGVFSGRSLIEESTIGPIAKEPQHWGGQWINKGFGVDYRLNNMLDFFDEEGDLIEEQTYSIILTCGIPYGYYLEKDLKIESLAEHALWFSQLARTMRNSLQDDLVVYLRNLGNKVSTEYDYYEMAGGAATIRLPNSIF